MKKTTHYCDYCGCEITNKRPKKIKTVWYKRITDIYDMITLSYNNTVITIGGDGCNNCYQSYKEWVNSRRR